MPVAPHQAQQAYVQGAHVPPAHQGAPYIPTAVAQPGANDHDLVLALKRAFRLRINPAEVLPKERIALEHAHPPVCLPDVQAFLAWRRSLLFVIAIGLTPIVLMQAIDTFKDADNTPESLLGLGVMKLLIDVGFTAFLWFQLQNWTRWKTQRRKLYIAWLIFFLTPFVIYLYPIRTIAEGQPPQQQLLVGLLGSVAAMLALAPKAVSLMPGIIRAAITSKLLFPGASGPGWVMILISPLYSILVFIVLIVPYQITGNGLFVLAMAGFIGAQFWLMKTAYRLGKPLSEQESVRLVRSARAGYLACNAFAMVFLVLALADLIDQLQSISILSMISSLIAILVNILLFTLIGTDLMVTNLARAHGATAGPEVATHLASYAESLTHFVPPAERPPPSSPA